MSHIHLYVKLKSGDTKKYEEFMKRSEAMINLQMSYNADFDPSSQILTVTAEKEEYAEALQELYLQLASLAHLANIELEHARVTNQ